MTTVVSQAAATSSPLVDRHDIDHSFDRIRAMVTDPNEGLFGPGSMIWRIVKPAPVVPLMLMQAGLLEAPHPYIAYGTVGSKSATEYIPRFHRSADAFYDWFGGDLETALRTARRIFGYHSQIKGSLPEDIGGFERGHAYAANEQDVLIWVWATIVRPMKELYEDFHGRLSQAEVGQYYDECLRFSLLFGIDQARLPTDWQSFIDYCDRTAASSLMDLSAEFLSRPGPMSGDTPGSLVARLLTTWVMSIEAYKLPAHVRDQYPNLPKARRHRLVAAASLRGLRVLWPLLPRDLREMPRCRADWRRVGAEGAPTRLGRWMAAKLPAPYSISYRAAGLTGHESAAASAR
ncbi:MAG: hypothetical protein JWP02_1201 [Acidimicrobiales bacterium]|nr:hypothetical protein [Acidimicrobiales bacterium]